MMRWCVWHRVKQACQLDTAQFSCLAYSTRTISTQRDQKFLSRNNGLLHMCNQLCGIKSSKVLYAEDNKKVFNNYYLTVKEDVEKNPNKKSLIELMRKRQAEKLDSQKIVNQWIFEEIVDLYIQQNPNRRMFVEFIEEALKKMTELDVNKNLSCYKVLVKVFPDEILVPKSRWQVEMKHFPKQQDCAVDLLEEMEYNAVMPDREIGLMLAEKFGPHSHVIRKYRRMMYWMPKFKNANPFKLPAMLPDCEIELAMLALRKMAIDIHNEITVWKVKDEELIVPRDTFIASAQSPAQRDLLKRHCSDIPLYVEGRFRVYLREKPINYFILRAESDPKLFAFPTKEEMEEDLFEFDNPFETESPKELVPRPSEHQQEDGTVLAMCVTGTSSKDSLISWIRYLKEANPILDETPIVFMLRTPEEAIMVLEEEEKKSEVTVKT